MLLRDIIIALWESHKTRKYILCTNYTLLYSLFLGDSPASEFYADVSEHCSIFTGHVNKKK